MKNLNKIFLGLSLFISASLCISCNDDSEKLTPGETMQNFYAPDPSDKSETAEIRRKFFSETGIYLLFSDVLGTYTDDFGMERTEKLDFRWGFNQHSPFSYFFNQVVERERDEVANLVKRFFIPYINIDGGLLKPYSILLVSNLNSNQGDTYEDPSPVDYMINWQCLALNADSWLEVEEDEEAVTLGKELLFQLISTKVTSSTPELEPFFVVSAQYYDAYYVADAYPEWIEEQDIELIYESGFLRYYSDFWGEIEYDSFVSEATDLNDFMKALFSENEEEFKEKWGSYPKIIEKYNVLKACIESMGVDFNAVK